MSFFKGAPKKKWDSFFSFWKDFVELFNWFQSNFVKKKENNFMYRKTNIVLIVYSQQPFSPSPFLLHTKYTYNVLSSLQNRNIPLKFSSGGPFSYGKLLHPHTSCCQWVVRPREVAKWLATIILILNNVCSRGGLRQPNANLWTSPLEINVGITASARAKVMTIVVVWWPRDEKRGFYFIQTGFWGKRKRLFWSRM